MHMRPIILALSLILSPVLAIAQQAEDSPTTLTVRSTLVQVPVQVKTKSGKNVFALTAGNFLVTDNGIPQSITLDDDAGAQPLALAIVVQAGGAGAQHLGDYYGLGPIIDGIIGGDDHRVAVVGFDNASQQSASERGIGDKADLELSGRFQRLFSFGPIE